MVDSVNTSDTSDASDPTAAAKYRFSGYQLPMIQLDETGPSYVVSGVHPYFINQPQYYQKPAYQYNHLVTTGDATPSTVDPSTVASPKTPETIGAEVSTRSSGLYRML